MRRLTLYILLVSCCCLGWRLSDATVRAQQQIVDPDFKPVVERPAYKRNGPTVAIDEAHSNFHTAGGQYRPFAELLRSDGYTVRASTRKFEKGAFDGVDVLVIANARAGVPSVPGLQAFTDEECDVLRDWVRRGGSLLLIADHAPFGGAVENLGERFGVSMGKGWAFDRAPAGGITTQLVFSRENGLLGAHPILRGRNSSEEVKTVRTFTGQSLGVPAGAAVLLKLSDTAREAPNTNDLNAEGAAARDAGASSGAFGAHSSPVAGRAQGIAMKFGKGRVVILGEAGMFSAQLIRFPEGSQQRDMKFGLNVPGHDDQQFALNVLHWLSKLLK